MNLKGLVAALALLLVVTWGAAAAAAEGIAYQATVGRDGTFEYSVPIPALPGTAGMQPTMALSYSSQGGPSPIGVGWGLSGVSQVSRGPRNLGTDGVTGAVALKASDALFLDGQRLIPIGQSTVGGATVAEYRKEADDHARITARLTANGQPGSWTVRTRGGLTLSLGGSANALVQVNGVTVTWLLDRIEDRAGNYMTFAYRRTGPDFDLQRVSYAGNAGAGVAPYAELYFDYAATTPYLTTWVAGTKLQKTHRLRRIVSRLVAPAAFDVFTLELEQDDTKTAGRFQLLRVKYIGNDGKAHRPLQFDYTAQLAAPWTRTGDFQLPVDISASTPTRALRLARLQAGGDANKSSLLYAAETAAGLEAKAYDAGPNGWTSLPSEQAPPIAFVDAHGRDRGVALVDANGDGRDDLLAGREQDGALLAEAWLHQSDGSWKKSDDHAPAFAFAPKDQDAHLVVANDLDGDGKPDLLARTADGWIATALKAATKWTVLPRLDLSGGVWGPYLLDADCDQRTDIATIRKAAGRLVLATYRFSGGAWVHETAWDKDLGDASDAVAAAIDTSSCAQLVLGVRRAGDGAITTHALTGAGGTGLTTMPNLAPPREAFWHASGKVQHPRAVDITSDGKTDLLVRETWADGVAVDLALVQLGTPDPGSGSRWRDTSGPGALSSPFLLAQDGEVRATVFLQTLDANANIDIVDFGQRGPGQVGAFLGGTSAWTPAADFTPPIEFARGGAHLGVQFVDLNADGRVDLLYNRKGKDGGDATCADGPADRGAFLNRGDRWECVSGYIPPLAIPDNANAGAGFSIVDVDNDGFVDLVYSYRATSGRIVHETRMNLRGQGKEAWGAADTTWKTPVVMADERLPAQSAYRLMDVNGDARVDLIQSYRSWDGRVSTSYYENNRAGWVAKSRDLPGGFVLYRQPIAGDAILSSPRQIPESQLIDVDGDRTPDFVERYVDDVTLQEVSNIFIWDGASYVKSMIKAPQRLDAHSANDKVNGYFFDIDGNGLADYYYFDGNAGRVYVNSGAGWDTSGFLDLPAEAISKGFRDAATRFMDLNADGLLDIAFHFATDPGKYKKGAYFNLGDGWAPAPEAFAPALAFFTDKGEDVGLRPIDVDGNGVPDLIKSLHTDKGLDQEVWLNMSRRADMLGLATDSQGLRTGVQYHALGEHRSLVAGETASSIYEHGAAASIYPTVSIAPAMYVVARLISDEGGGRTRATRFRYGDLRLDVALARSVGFAWKETLDESSGTRVRSEFRQDPWLSGRLAREATRVTASGVERLISDQSTTWEKIVLNGLNRPDGTPYAYAQLQVKGTKTTSADLDGSTLGAESTDYEYDDAGNVKLSVSLRADGSSVRTENTYESDAEAKWLGRLSVSTVTKLLPGASDAGSCAPPKCERRRADFSYFPDTLLLQTETANAHSSQSAVRTSYERDAFGNIKSKTHHPLAPGAPDRVETFAYVGGAGRLLSRTANALGQAGTQEYGAPLNIALGLPSAAIDANGLRTTFDYDGFGRTVRATDPGGVSVERKLLDGDAIPAAFLVGLKHDGALRPQACLAQEQPTWRAPVAAYAWLTQRSASGTTLRPDLEIFDRAGRMIRRATYIFDGTTVRVTFTDQEFDDFGRLRGQSRPFFSGTPSRWSLVQYDRLGRPVATANPDSSCRQLVRSGATLIERTRTAANKPFRERVSQLNAAGAPISISDSAGGTLTYQYDAGGRLVRLTDAKGAVSTYAYDDAGHRIRAESPDSGSWTYSYDAYGQLRTQAHASHVLQPTRLDYDVLGRIERVTASEHTTRWTYVSPGQTCGADRISSVEKTAIGSGAAPNYREIHEYDGLCRGSKVTVTVTNLGAGMDPDLLPANPLASETTYDAFGRPTLSIYPRAFAGPTFITQNTYHPETGVLTEVKEVSASGIPGRRLWVLKGVGADQRITREQRGDNVDISSGFDAATGRMTDLKAVAGQGSLFQEAYSYDLVGNLIQRNDKFGSQNTYRYDDLDRLTTVLAGTSVVQSVKYDAAGRIIYKSDVGHYRYGAGCGASTPGEQQALTRPFHGVCGVAANENVTALTERYQYDARGNMVRSPTAKLSYSIDNRLVRTEQRDLDPNAAEDAGTQYREFYGYAPGGAQFMTLSTRVKWGNAAGFRSIATYRLGLYQVEVRKTEGGDSVVRADRWYIRANRQMVGFVEAADYTRAANEDMPALLAAKPQEQRIVEGRLFVLLQDRLGSVRAVVNESGAVVQRFAFDPWGRATSASKPPVDVTTDGVVARWSDGFGGHEHLLVGVAVMNLVHMGGRVYDSRLGVFLSPDPVLTDPGSSQDLNPYMYVLGNPFAYTDPTGYSWLSDFFSNPFKALEDLHRNFINEAERGLRGLGDWVESDWREIVGVGIAIVVTVNCPPCAANPIIGGLVFGATQAGSTTALYGGDASQVLEASARGGAIGMVGGVASFAAGSYVSASIRMGGPGAASWQAAVAHGVAGGVSSVAGGGRFETGFVSGALTQAITHNTGVHKMTGVGRVAANAAIGGMNAEIGGENFANGARYGAFQVMFNDWAEEHKIYDPNDMSQWSLGEPMLTWKGDISLTDPSGTVSWSIFEREFEFSIPYPRAGVSVNVGSDGVSSLSVGAGMPLFGFDVGTGVLVGNDTLASGSLRVGLLSGQVSARPGPGWYNVLYHLDQAIRRWMGSACMTAGCYSR